jgi:hypothetical protein
LSRGKETDYEPVGLQPRVVKEYGDIYETGRGKKKKKKPE